MHQFQWVQKSLCGFGCLNFSALATMAVTAMTIKANSVCKTGVASLQKTDYTADTLGRIGHSFESFGFYASMLFFVLVGFATDKWVKCGGRRLEAGIVSAMVVALISCIYFRVQMIMHSTN